jgi:hypothetical protein
VTNFGLFSCRFESVGAAKQFARLITPCARLHTSRFFCSATAVQEDVDATWMYGETESQTRSPSLMTVNSPSAHRHIGTSHCGYRARSTLMFDEALSTARRSSGVSSTFAAPRVFFKAMQLGGARNRNDPRFLGKQPGKRELSRCRLLLLREFAQQINQRLVRFTVLWVRTWHGVAET